MRVFFDTNIILYAVTVQDAAKHEVAGSLLENHLRSEAAVISTQVIQEAHSNLVGKFRWPGDRAEELLVSLLKLPVIASTGPFVLSAARLSRVSQISIWDA